MSDKTLCFKKNCDLDVLTDLLRLDPLSDEFESIETLPYNGVNDNLIIKFKRSFFSHEKDKIKEIVLGFDNTHPLIARKAIKDKVSTPAIIAGQDIMAEYGAMNLAKNKNLEQYLTIFSLLDKMMTYLMSGSLELAQYELVQIRNNPPENGAITVEECDEFLRRLDVYINSLKG